MKNHSKLFAAAAAALILSTPVFAQSHHDTGSCPHHQATETAVSEALALLDHAKTQNGDQAKATVGQARQHLAEAQKHMAACEEMCDTKMQGHENHGQGHENHGDHSGHATHQGHTDHPGAAPAAAGQAQVTDPVCGMKVDPKTAAAKSVYAGKTYYFCSKGDKEKFDQDPEKFLKKQG